MSDKTRPTEQRGADGESVAWSLSLGTFGGRVTHPARFFNNNQNTKFMRFQFIGVVEHVTQPVQITTNSGKQMLKSTIAVRPVGFDPVDGSPSYEPSENSIPVDLIDRATELGAQFQPGQTVKVVGEVRGHWGFTDRNGQLCGRVSIIGRYIYPHELQQQQGTQMVAPMQGQPMQTGGVFGGSQQPPFVAPQGGGYYSGR